MIMLYDHVDLQEYVSQFIIRNASKNCSLSTFPTIFHDFPVTFETAVPCSDRGYRLEIAEPCVT